MGVAEARAAVDAKTAATLAAILLFAVALDLAGTAFPRLPVLSEKDSFLNQWFFKLGWAWTLAAWLVPLMLAGPSPAPRTAGVGAGARGREEEPWRAWAGAAARVAVATALWYVFVGCFNTVQFYSGSCSNEAIAHPRHCTREGHEWSGMDISGHCFLIVFSSLILWSESKQRPSPQGGGGALRSAAEWAVLALRLLWFVGLWATCCYFHEVHDKVLGCLFGAMCWYLTYGLLPLYLDLLLP